MCGQVGIIFGVNSREQKDVYYLQRLFVYCLIRSEERGPHATGAAWISADGMHGLLKRPVPASRFVRDRAFTGLIEGVDEQTVWLAGHTRWQTRGSAANNANNHPLHAGTVVGTHNGTILNADELFEELNLPRAAEVDSEIIFRMADSVVTRSGRINIGRLVSRLSRCRGEMSAVMASKRDPTRVIVVKGNKPLELRFHKELNVIVYASDARYLDSVITPNLGWRHVGVEPMKLVVFDCHDLQSYRPLPLRLAKPTVRRSSRRFVRAEAGTTDKATREEI